MSICISVCMTDGYIYILYINYALAKFFLLSFIWITGNIILYV